jgi:hypothetical protein
MIDSNLISPSRKAIPETSGFIFPNQSSASRPSKTPFDVQQGLRLSEQNRLEVEIDRRVAVANADCDRKKARQEISN